MRDLNLTIVATYRDVIANSVPPHPLAIAISTLKVEEGGADIRVARGRDMGGE